ncbi:MAG: porin [Pararobbsia sp.]
MPEAAHHAALAKQPAAPHGTRHLARQRLLAVLAATGGCLGLVGPASADAEFSLYGEIDTGLTYASAAAREEGGHGNRLTATSSNVTGSFFGLRGVEDLGGGASALFTIERGVDVTNGEGSSGQPMFVGLSHTDWGTLTLGHQNDAINDYLAPLTLTGSDGGTYFAHPFDNDNANATYLVDRSVKWESPTWHGFHFGGAYSIESDAPGPHTWSVGAVFGEGPLSLAASYAQSGGLPLEDDLGTAVGDALARAGVKTSPGDALRLSRRAYGTGINYELGDATLGAVWTHSRHEGRTNESGRVGGGAKAAGRIDFDNYEFNARYRAGALSFAGAYTFTQGGAHSSDAHLKAAWHQFGLLANYAMSKRTDLYVEGIHQRTTNGTPLAFVYGVGSAASDQQSVLAMGMRHRF